jgi:HSP20 family molecular chaperone IbpA
MTTTLVNSPFGTRLFPTDLLFKNFFDQASAFESSVDRKINHPVDIIYTEEALLFEIAAVGLAKKDIELNVEDGNCLKVSYTKPSIESNNSDLDAGEYIHRGIAKRSFDLGWKISPKFDLTKVAASMENGLLKIEIPVNPVSLQKTITIK